MGLKVDRKRADWRDLFYAVRVGTVARQVFQIAAERRREARMLYQTIEVRKLNPVIGAEISGIDVSRDLGNQQFEEVHDALMENLVIFFRNQNLTVEQHKAFGQRFGKLHVHPNAPQELADHPEILAALPRS
jgi:hypothetical protein